MGHEWFDGLEGQNLIYLVNSTARQKSKRSGEGSPKGLRLTAKRVKGDAVRRCVVAEAGRHDPAFGTRRTVTVIESVDGLFCVDGPL